jgi:hypothetical protein
VPAVADGSNTLEPTRLGLIDDGINLGEVGGRVSDTGEDLLDLLRPEESGQSRKETKQESASLVRSSASLRDVNGAMTKGMAIGRTSPQRKEERKASGRRACLQRRPASR